MKTQTVPECGLGGARWGVVCGRCGQLGGAGLSPVLDATTVFADGEADTLTGGAEALDLFFASLDLDVLSDPEEAEVLVPA